MLRLRTAIQRGLRHPLAGPLLLLVLAALLVFVVLHVVEHGSVGDIVAYLGVVAYGLWLLRIGRGTPAAETRRAFARRRGPPALRPSVGLATQPALFSPLRR